MDQLIIAGISFIIGAFVAPLVLKKGQKLGEKAKITESQLIEKLQDEDLKEATIAFMEKLRDELGTVEGYGLGVRLAVRYGTKPITSSTLAYVQANGEVAGTGIGCILKGGYEVGLLIQVTKKGIVRPYVGGYFWPMMDWETDFSGIETDAGYSAGLQFELLW